MTPGTIMLAVYEPLPQWLNFLAMFLAVALGAFGVFLWAIKFRRRRKRKHRHHRHGEHRRERRPNPTLAERGGLPPPRPTENASDSSSSP